MRKGLTLMELLIIAALIAILITLFFSVLSHVREKIRQTVCMSNLKQIGIALHMYARDWNDFAPPYTNYPEPILVYDFRGQERRIDISRLCCTSKPIRMAFDPYLKSKEIWFCPSDEYAGKDFSHRKPDEPPYNLGMPPDRTLTSYYISAGNAAFAPVQVHNPPRLRKEDFTIPPPDWPKDFPYMPPEWLWLDEAYYADCQSHLSPRGPFRHPKADLHIRLKFDGSVKCTLIPIIYLGGD